MKIVNNLFDLSFIQHGFYNAFDSGDDPSPILMQQVHSADCLFITEALSEKPKVDALITQTPHLNLTVYTADCVPILLADPTSHMIAAIHAGWRGAFQGIIENTILEMMKHGTDISSIRAGIGPHIQKQSFEISQETKALFPATEAVFFTEENGELHFDFDAYVQHRLKRTGILSINSLLDDTVSDIHYNSFRRNQTTARQYSSIMIREKV